MDETPDAKQDSRIAPVIPFQWKPGQSGNPAGRPSVLGKVRDIARGLVNDPGYLENLKQALIERKVAPAVEIGLWHYAWGKPKETVVVEDAAGMQFTGPMLFQILVQQAQQNPGTLKEIARQITAGNGNGNGHTPIELAQAGEIRNADILKAAAHAGAYTILDLFDTLPWFNGAADWTAWRAFLCAVYGLPMTDQELAIYRRCTKRDKPPTTKAKEVWVPTGRRARKTAIEALIGVWEGCLARDMSQHLAPDEDAVIPILARNKADAKQCFQYAKGILNCNPTLKSFIRKEPAEGAEEIELTTRVILRIKAATLMAGRSKTSPCGLFDEVAFFKSDESVAPDKDIIDGFRPAMATVPGAILIAVSSPYARRGELWRHYQDHFGKEDDPILIWQADTITMHDTPQLRAFVSEQTTKDPIAAAAEYGAKFRTDVVAYVPEELVRACTSTGITERPPTAGCYYYAFVDPSGGISDAMSLCISHWDQVQQRVVVDFIRWQDPDPDLGPFDPLTVVDTFKDDLRRYGIKHVWGDRYAGDWPAAAFRRPREGRKDDSFGYVVADKSTSDIYLELSHIMTSSQVWFLDQPRFFNELTSLDRFTGRGKDVIDHRPGEHDDVSNCVAGAVWITDVARRKRDVEPPPVTPEQAHIQEQHAYLRRTIQKLAQRGTGHGKRGQGFL